jgi:flagellar motility protein MotE (MotC chaperone)
MVKAATAGIRRKRHCGNRLRRALAGIGYLAIGLFATPATAEEPAAEQVSDQLRYCEAIHDSAREARAAWQAQALLEIEERIEKRLEDLARERAAYEDYLARREEFLRRAEEGVIEIYARMRPDAAAAQLAAMDNQTASAVIAKLNPRQASAILNEMEPGRAALLTRTVAGSALDQENAL